jgi:hypothetical protein
LVPSHASHMHPPSHIAVVPREEEEKKKKKNKKKKGVRETDRQTDRQRERGGLTAEQESENGRDK